jgi:hypothetical protein
MNDLDHAIRQSLSAEDTELLDHLSADQALHRQVLATFAGQLRWFNAIASIAGIGLFGVAVFLGWRFLHVETVQEMLRWGAASALAFGGVAFIKLWFWLELQKNALVRELKRLELQVASLAAQLRRQ